MQNPANFDSLVLDGLLVDWLSALQSSSIEGLIVLGPSIFGDVDHRMVQAVYPPKLLDTARSLAESTDFGHAWQIKDSPLIAWQNISFGIYSDLSRWRMLALGHGLQSMVRVEFSYPESGLLNAFC
jgi:LuxR family quorum-sensing system transcriptional regulator SolR